MVYSDDYGVQCDGQNSKGAKFNNRLEKLKIYFQ